MGQKEEIPKMLTFWKWGCFHGPKEILLLFSDERSWVGIVVTDGYWFPPLDFSDIVQRSRLMRLGQVANLRWFAFSRYCSHCAHCQLYPSSNGRSLVLPGQQLTLLVPKVSSSLNLQPPVQSQPSSSHRQAPSSRRLAGSLFFPPPDEGTSSSPPRVWLLQPDGEDRRLN